MTSTTFAPPTAEQLAPALRAGTKMPAEFLAGAAARPQPGVPVDGHSLYPRLVHPAPVSDPAEAAPAVAELSGWREALRWIADTAGPAPQRIVVDRGVDVDAALSMTFAALGDLQAWLNALDVPDGEVEVLAQERAGVPGAFALSRPMRFGLQLRLTAWEPTAAGDRDDPEVPEECVAAVPPLDELVDAAGEPPPDVGEHAAAAARMSERWSAIAAGLAAGCPAPLSANVSEDGWRLQISVAAEADVMVWGRHLGVLDTWAARVHSPRRGTAVRTTTVSRTHPWQVEVVHTAAVTWPPAGLADVLPWPARADGEQLGAAA